MTWLDALGWAGSALLVVSVMQTRILRLRLLNLVATVALLAFNLGIRVWPMVAMNAVLALINVVFIVRLLREQRPDSGVYEVLAVAGDDTYLDHFLRRQARDIARFNASSPASPVRGDAAYLVQRGNETVGVVLVHDAGDGVAQVDLDYVTPPFRDLSPGRFVYRTSDLFRRKGFRMVLSPPAMSPSAAGPYYERLGFRRHDDRWALDLPQTPQA